LRHNLTLWAKIALILALALVLAGCGGALPATSWAGLTVNEGVAYVTATNQVLAIDSANGTVRWTFKSEVTQPGLFGSSQQVIPVHAMPAVYNGLLFIGSDGQTRDDGRVRALNTDAGTLQWQFPPEGQPSIGNIFAGLVVQDSTLYFVSTDRVYAMNAETGEKLWDVSVGSRVWATPLLAHGHLYVSTLEHKLFALDVSNSGETVWTFDEAQGSMVGSPVTSDDTVYVGSFDNRLYALDAQTGQPRWNYDTHNWVWDGLLVVDDTIYVGDLGGYVQALDTQNGQPRWSQPAKVDGAVRANLLYLAASADQEAMLLAVTDQGYAYALDPDNGSVRWTVKAPSSRLLTRPVVDNETLILATLIGPVQVYGVDIAALPDAYQQQEVVADGRAPILLLKENEVNTNVVRWYYPPVPSK